MTFQDISPREGLGRLPVGEDHDLRHQFVVFRGLLGFRV